MYQDQCLGPGALLLMVNLRLIVYSHILNKSYIICFQTCCHNFIFILFFHFIVFIIVYYFNAFYHFWV